MTTIQEYAQRNVGQMALPEAKISEFRALVQMGVDPTKARDDAHTILDAYMDGLAEFTEAARRGDFA